MLIRYRIAEPGSDDIEIYHRMRTEVYLEAGLISHPDVDRETGLFTDRYDEHSIHLLAANDDGVDIGCWRMVESGPGRTLPVTDLFDVEVMPRSYESSGSAIVPAYRKTLVGLGFFRAMFAVADERGLDNAYGIVEPPYLATARAIGIPIEVLSEPRHVYNADNVAIVVRRDALMAVIDTVAETVPAFVDFFLKPFDWTISDQEFLPA
jgi:N-acyl-L-homoserine lactone synthetase